MLPNATRSPSRHVSAPYSAPGLSCNMQQIGFLTVQQVHQFDLVQSHQPNMACVARPTIHTPAFSVSLPQLTVSMPMSSTAGHRVHSSRPRRDNLSVTPNVNVSVTGFDRVRDAFAPLRLTQSLNDALYLSVNAINGHQQVLLQSANSTSATSSLLRTAASTEPSTSKRRQRRSQASQQKHSAVQVERTAERKRTRTSSQSNARRQKLQDISSAAAQNNQNQNQSGSAADVSRYKTELCRSFEDTGECRYGEKCQFAHGRAELRLLSRHPKYKTELCRSFHTNGFCGYGQRCNFVHDESFKASAANDSAPKLADAREPTSTSMCGLETSPVSQLDLYSDNAVMLSGEASNDGGNAVWASKQCSDSEWSDQSMISMSMAPSISTSFSEDDSGIAPSVSPSVLVHLIDNAGSEVSIRAGSSSAENESNSDIDVVFDQENFDGAFNRLSLDANNNEVDENNNSLAAPWIDDRDQSQTVFRAPLSPMSVGQRSPPLLETDDLSGNDKRLPVFASLVSH